MEKLTGYSDKICGSPGEAISFKVSSPQRLSYQAELVRLRCADSSATGPGFKEFSLPAAFTGEHTGRRQRIGIGSFVKADNITAFDLKRVTLLSLIWPTLPDGKEQALMGTWDPKAKSGYGLFITKHGTLSFSVGNGSEPVFTVDLETPLQPRHWYLVAATYNDETGEAIIHQIPQFQYAYSSDSITKSQIKKVHDKADELPKKDFRDRYGKEKGDSVRYGVATKMIKKKMNIENNNHPGKELYETIKGLKNKAEKSGMPYSILKKVYDRGMAAWRGGHRPGTSQQQWAFARVNSFVTKSSGTWGGADKDLAKQVRGSK